MELHREAGRGKVLARRCDYVIVGAGSAGCVVARRLLDGSDATVLLLQAGGSDEGVQSLSNPPQWVENLDPQDPVLNRAAQAWKDRYKIPDNECFARAGPTPPGSTSTAPNCLAGPVCFLPTKLMIFAPGNE